MTPRAHVTGQDTPAMRRAASRRAVAMPPGVASQVRGAGLPQSAGLPRVAGLPQIVSVPPPASTVLSATSGLAQAVPIQPDANGAGGAQNFVEAANESFAVYSLNGTLQYTTTFDAWLGRPNGVPFYDPVVVWDQWGGRFLLSLDTGDGVILAAAQQTSAVGKWCKYNFHVSPGVDFDKLGVNGGAVYFSFNWQSSNGVPVSNTLYMVNRTQLESCQQTLSYTYWTRLTNPDGSLAEAIVPAREDTSGGGVEYLVNARPRGGCSLTLWKLTGSGNLSNTSINTQCYSPPPPAKQAGSSSLINADDSSLSQASYLNGLLTVATEGSHDWGDGNGPVGIVEWFVLNPAAATVDSQGAFGIRGYSLLYPAAYRNGLGNMLFVYDACGPSIHPSIWMVHYVNQTYAGSQALAKGVSYYARANVSNWGDYQSAWPDVSGNAPNAVWITGAYAGASNTWGTKFALVTP